MKTKDAVALCDTIYNKCEEGMEDDDMAQDGLSFLESVQHSVVKTQETIQGSGRVTAAQERALRNWEQGVDKWMN